MSPSLRFSSSQANPKVVLRVASAVLKFFVAPLVLSSTMFAGQNSMTLSAQNATPMQ